MSGFNLTHNVEGKHTKKTQAGVPAWVKRAQENALPTRVQQPKESK